MDLRSALTLTTVASAATLTGCVSSTVETEIKPAKRPNLIYVYPDEMRATTMGFLGKEPVITPNLDKFSKESLVLTNVGVNYPVCVPYRCMLMTGMYPHNNGVITNCFRDGKDLPAQHVWWSDVLNDGGYDCGYIGKWHITKTVGAEYKGEKLKGHARGWVPKEKRHGFKYWRSHTSNNHLKAPYWTEKDKPQDVKIVPKWTAEFDADNAIEFLDNKGGKFRDPNKPFALAISMNPPHSPYKGFVPKKYVDMYKDMTDKQLCDSYPNVPAEGTQWGDYYRKQVRSYYGAVTGVDEQFGRILDSLKKNGLDDNTIVVFTSDHGNCLGRHEMITKNNHFEESMKVPFLVRWPGKIKPRQDDLLLSTPDIYPTLLDLMGHKEQIPEAVDGVSHAKLFRTGKGSRPTSQIYMWVTIDDHAYGRRGVRTDRYTLCLDRGREESRGGKIPLKISLYDRKEDPHQLKNLADLRPDLVKELINTELIPWLRKTNDPWLKGEGNFPSNIKQSTRNIKQ